MKPSPLRLNWIKYPAASFELDENYEGDTSEALEADVVASVRYLHNQSEHFVYIEVSNKDGVPSPYRFRVVAVAGFSFDLDIAKREYKVHSKLPTMIAVNVARIMYSSAREFLAMMTSRSPYPTAVINSLLIGPEDVDIGSDASPAEVLRDNFLVSDDELDRYSSTPLPESIPKKTVARRATPKKKGN